MVGIGGLYKWFVDQSNVRAVLDKDKPGALDKAKKRRFNYASSTDFPYRMGLFDVPVRGMEKGKRIGAYNGKRDLVKLGYDMPPDVMGAAGEHEAGHRYLYMMGYPNHTELDAHLTGKKITLGTIRNLLIRGREDDARRWLKVLERSEEIEDSIRGRG